MPICHHPMSQYYSEHCSPQMNVGFEAINDLLNLIKLHPPKTEKVNVLDIGCGPGHLTQKLQTKLNEVLPHKQINMHGLDLDAYSLQRLNEQSGHTIKTIQASFYDPGLTPGLFNCIYSNEAMHWQMPYPLPFEGFVHNQGPQYERSLYHKWAYNNLEQGLTNVYKLLTTNGVAVIQMGHYGQLQSLFDLMDELLNEQPFTDYKHLISMPLFYPTIDEFHELIQQSGFKPRDYCIRHGSRHFIDPDSEKPAKAITNTLRAFTESAFSQVLSLSTVNHYFYCLQQELEQTDDIHERYIYNQWRRTFLMLHKSPDINDDHSHSVN